MIKYFICILLIVLSASGMYAQSAVDLEKEKAELLRMHKLGREAHFKTDADLLLQGSAAEFISVSRGKISRPKQADQRKRFTEYFKDAKYFEWDDLEEPVVRISKDGSMAWMITRIKVRRTQKDASGKEIEEKFVYAGIMTYEKQNGKWVRVANVSTFEPPN